jgi:hypothetical protein
MSVRTSVHMLDESSRMLRVDPPSPDIYPDGFGQQTITIQVVAITGSVWSASALAR